MWPPGVATEDGVGSRPQLTAGGGDGRRGGEMRELRLPEPGADGGRGRPALRSLPPAAARDRGERVDPGRGRHVGALVRAVPDGQPGAGAGGHRTGRADQAGEGQRGQLPPAAAALQCDGHPDAYGAAARAGSGAAGRRGAGREPARLGRGGPRELAGLGMRPRPHRRDAVITEPATGEESWSLSRRSPGTRSSTTASSTTGAWPSWPG